MNNIVSHMKRIFEDKYSDEIDENYQRICPTCNHLRYAYEYYIKPNKCISCLKCRHDKIVNKCKQCRALPCNMQRAFRELPMCNQ